MGKKKFRKVVKKGNFDWSLFFGGLCFVLVIFYVGGIPPNFHWYERLGFVVLMGVVDFFMTNLYREKEVYYEEI